MTHNKMKTIKLTGELLSFFCNLGAKEISVKITKENEFSIISVVATIENIKEEILEKAKNNLALPHEEQIEEYYWELLGEDEGSNELSLAGMLTQKSEVTYENKVLRISLYL